MFMLKLYQSEIMQRRATEFEVAIHLAVTREAVTFASHCEESTVCLVCLPFIHTECIYFKCVEI